MASKMLEQVRAEIQFPINPPNTHTQWSWAVVGGHGRNPICDRLVHKLQLGNKKVFKVNPGNATGTDIKPSLRAVGEPIDCVDLVINPAKGPAVLQEMADLGIKYLWIQPGAESKEILELANKLNITVHMGCVLVEAKW